MTTASAAEGAQREAIRKEALRIHESSVSSSQGQLEASKVWRTAHWTLGGLTAVVSALSAVLTFAGNSQAVGGTLAVVAALLAAVLTITRLDALAERAAARGNDYIALRNDARRLLHIQVPVDSIAVLRKALEVLAARAAALDKTSDPIPRFAYLRGKRNIDEDGGQTFGADSA